MRYTVKSKCPECGLKSTVPIIYGSPSFETFEEEQKGKLVLGGCCVEPDSPKYSCKDCYCQWGGETPLIEGYQDIKIITACLGGYPGPFFEAGINLLESKARWTKREGYKNKNEETKDKLLDKEELDAFARGIEECNLLGWGKRYYMPACDGTSWAVYINFGDMVIQKEGSNAFPKQWEEFCALIKNTVDGEFY